MFNAAQIHLAFNHIPIVGFLFIAPLLFLTIFIKKNEYKRLALLGTVLISLFSLPVFFSGEPAEKTIKNLPGIQKQQIEKHEETAEGALIASLITGCLATAGYFLSRKREQTLKWLVPLVFASSAVSVGLMVATGHEGGKIRHTELSETP